MVEDLATIDRLTGLYEAETALDISLQEASGDGVSTDDYLGDLALITSSSSREYVERSFKRLVERFSREATPRILSMIREQELEYGYESPAEQFIREKFAESPSVAKEWLGRLFLEYFDAPDVLVALLHAISHFEYNDIFPTGQMMALAALRHENPEVRESGVRALESWGNSDSLKVLRAIRFREKWLQNYVEQVVRDLEQELQ